ncbi:hypothetical protein F4801DRAFT_602581 [Xylaria longipes]|nr:hypothetical protein F4801DRAFT_602581 [Xylaria longipes]
MSSLMILPNEVLESIVDILFDTSTYYTLRSLGGANHVLRAIVLYRQYSEVRIPLKLTPKFVHANIADPIYAYIRFLDSHSLLPAVRSAGLIHPRDFRPWTPYAWKVLYENVQRFTGLREVHVPVPFGATAAVRSPLAQLLVLLKMYMPLVVVHARLMAPEFGFPPLRVFQDFSNLYALEFTVYKSLDFNNAPPEILPILRSILVTCPNLRILKLYTRTLRAARHMWYHSYPPTYDYVERPRCLEILDLQDRDSWRFDRIPDSLWREDVANLPRVGDESWVPKFFNWSKLSHLRIKEVTLLPYITNKLIALKSFEATNALGFDRHDVKRFLLNLPSRLESIKVPAWDFIPLKSLIRYAHTLRALHFTHSSIQYRGRILTTYKIQLIRAFCPCLEEFGLSIHRRGSWPQDVLNALASFPRLRSLTVVVRYCEVDVSYMYAGSHLHLTSPFITFNEVGNLYKLLISAELWQGSTLRRLEYRRLVFKVKPAERDDEAARGLLDVTCKQVSKAGNEAFKVIRDTGRTPEDVLESNPLPMDFHLAYYGPIKHENYESDVRWSRDDVDVGWDSGDDAEEGIYRYGGEIDRATPMVGEVDDWGDERMNVDDGAGSVHH